ncbi:MAG TPA: aspartyl-phosphate phosphatase Spo0E family protein [Thermaerobacter sp.]
MPPPQPARRPVGSDLVEHRAAQAEIERLRRMLYRLARRRGCSDPEVLELSRQLDALIVGWYRAHRGGDALRRGPATTASW